MASNLPHELVVCVASFLQVKEVLSAVSVCKSWAYALTSIESNELWKNLLHDCPFEFFKEELFGARLTEVQENSQIQTMIFRQVTALSNRFLQMRSEATAWRTFCQRIGSKNPSISLSQDDFKQDQSNCVPLFVDVLTTESCYSQRLAEFLCLAFCCVLPNNSHWDAYHGCPTLGGPIMSLLSDAAMLRANWAINAIEQKFRPGLHVKSLHFGEKDTQVPHPKICLWSPQAVGGAGWQSSFTSEVPRILIVCYELNNPNSFASLADTIASWSQLVEAAQPFSCYSPNQLRFLPGNLSKIKPFYVDALDRVMEDPLLPEALPMPPALRSRSFHDPEYADIPDEQDRALPGRPHMNICHPKIPHKNQGVVRPRSATVLDPELPDSPLLCHIGKRACSTMGIDALTMQRENSIDHITSISASNCSIHRRDPELNPDDVCMSDEFQLDPNADEKKAEKSEQKQDFNAYDYPKTEPLGFVYIVGIKAEREKSMDGIPRDEYIGHCKSCSMVASLPQDTKEYVNCEALQQLKRDVEDKCLVSIAGHIVCSLNNEDDIIHLASLLTRASVLTGLASTVVNKGAKIPPRSPESRRVMQIGLSTCL